MGGGGGGGGAMRTFQRAVRAGVGSASPPNTTTPVGASKTAGKAKNLNKKQPISPDTALTLNSSMLNLPMSASSAPAWISSSFSTICSDESEWEYVDGIDDETAARGFYDDYVFGTVPSSDEVHRAVSALQM